MVEQIICWVVICVMLTVSKRKKKKLDIYINTRLFILTIGALPIEIGSTKLRLIQIYI